MPSIKHIHIKKLFWLTCLILTACGSSSVETTSTKTTSPSPSPTPAVSSAPQTQPNPSAKQPIPNPVFKTILPTLKQQTKFPILLPDILGSDGATPVYAILEKATPTQYQIILGFTENCNGGTACRHGDVSGEAKTPQSPPLTGKPVSLDNGIKGYFVDATCGANCSDSTLTWEQNGARYTVGIKAGKLETLVKMANSAIATGSF